MENSAVLVTLISFACLALGYVIYGRFLARRVFRLDPHRRTPAHELEDGVDYVPTRIPILFGHHFASIAGLGPILGPAVAVIWGWVPAVIWAVAGSILVGAVHDLGSLTVSMRFKGRSIGDVCREIIGPRARFLFLVIIFFLMSLAMGAFVSAISSLFVNFNPDAIIPTFGLMLIAMVIGVVVYKLRAPLGPVTVIGLLAFGGLIAWGVAQPVLSYEWFLDSETRTVLAEARAEAATAAPAVTTPRGPGGTTGTSPAAAEGVASPPAAPPAVPELAAPYGATAMKAYLEATGRQAAADKLTKAEENTRFGWLFILLAYGFLASVLPVWLLLQPRDYINSFQLYFALGALLLGLIVAGVTGSQVGVIQAPAIRYSVADSPPLFPFLFVTIACGAVSGFHSLVSSGTTVRQLNRETDALPIGFGGMLTEGALAVIVIMACVAGLGVAAWQDGGVYSSWKGTGSLGAQLSAVVHGGANFLALLGVPARFGQAFLAVTIVAFAMTTLDSATRLLRFNVEEIFRGVGLKPLANRYVASLVAVGGIAAFALLPGGKTLWVMFGTTNQLLAGLALLTISLFLYKLGRPILYTLIPMAMMLVMTVWAMIWKLDEFLAVEPEKRSPLLIGTTIVVLVLSAWLIVEAAISFARGPGGLDLDAETPPELDHQRDEVTDAVHLG
ncbi:MAG: carbon starvation protein A [Pirellulaceae bacterium]|nr:carbon starvation protein A [Pirellulaceae bacterium]